MLVRWPKGYLASLKSVTRPSLKHDTLSSTFPRSPGWPKLSTSLPPPPNSRYISAYVIWLVLIFKSKDSKCFGKSELSSCC